MVPAAPVKGLVLLILATGEAHPAATQSGPMTGSAPFSFAPVDAGSGKKSDRDCGQ
jgi:hypothetical protein